MPLENQFNKFETLTLIMNQYIYSGLRPATALYDHYSLLYGVWGLQYKVLCSLNGGTRSPLVGTSQITTPPSCRLSRLVGYLDCYSCSASESSHLSSLPFRSSMTSHQVRYSRFEYSHPHQILPTLGHALERR